MGSVPVVKQLEMLITPTSTPTAPLQMFAVGNLLTLDFTRPALTAGAQQGTITFTSVCAGGNGGLPFQFSAGFTSSDVTKHFSLETDSSDLVLYTCRFTPRYANAADTGFYADIPPIYVRVVPLRALKVIGDLPKPVMNTTTEPTLFTVNITNPVTTAGDDLVVSLTCDGATSQVPTVTGVSGGVTNDPTALTVTFTNANTDPAVFTIQAPPVADGAAGLGMCSYTLSGSLSSQFQSGEDTSFPILIGRPIQLAARLTNPTTTIIAGTSLSFALAAAEGETWVANDADYYWPQLHFEMSIGSTVYWYTDDRLSGESTFSAIAPPYVGQAKLHIFLTPYGDRPSTDAFRFLPIADVEFTVVAPTPIVLAYPTDVLPIGTESFQVTATAPADASATNQVVFSIGCTATQPGNVIAQTRVLGAAQYIDLSSVTWTTVGQTTTFEVKILGFDGNTTSQRTFCLPAVNDVDGNTLPQYSLPDVFFVDSTAQVQLGMVLTSSQVVIDQQVGVSLTTTATVVVNQREFGDLPDPRDWSVAPTMHTESATGASGRAPAGDRKRAEKTMSTDGLKVYVDCLPATCSQASVAVNQEDYLAVNHFPSDQIWIQGVSAGTVECSFRLDPSSADPKHFLMPAPFTLTVLPVLSFTITADGGLTPVPVSTGGNAVVSQPALLPWSPNAQSMTFNFQVAAPGRESLLGLICFRNNAQTFRFDIPATGAATASNGDPAPNPLPPYCDDIGGYCAFVQFNADTTESGIFPVTVQRPNVGPAVVTTVCHFSSGVAGMYDPATYAWTVGEAVAIRVWVDGDATNIFTGASSPQVLVAPISLPAESTCVWTVACVSTNPAAAVTWDTNQLVLGSGASPSTENSGPTVTATQPGNVTCTFTPSPSSPETANFITPRYEPTSTERNGHVRVERVGRTPSRRHGPRSCCSCRIRCLVGRPFVLCLFEAAEATGIDKSEANATNAMQLERCAMRYDVRGCVRGPEDA
ncbi:MAG: hypothetical protein P4L86_07670 [Mycobacterium sp.]|nr:hypothetical protein [Mycobacterium sp.]